ncbi:MAG: hypothetical protein HYW06_05815 [Gemmatimonadetes bacterium]|nr:hypothetical protein [Gemmatimonadota bacterium]
MPRVPAAVVMVLVLAGCVPVHGPRGTYLDVIRPDQHPPLIGASAAADSLWGPADQSEAGDGIAESRRTEFEQLVRRFNPTVVLPPGDFVRVGGRKYRLFPTNAALFADTLRIDYIQTAPYQFYDSLNVTLAAISADSLRALVAAARAYQADPDLLAAWYFDFPGGNPKEWWQAYARLRTGPDSVRWGRPTVYAHPFVNPNGRVIIQYWFFYPFNDYIGNHEGDWEHVDVMLSEDPTAIEGANYFFHARSITLPQGKLQPEVVDGTHIIVYVGGRMYNVLDYPIRIVAGDRNEGSHGNFPFAGEWEAAAGLGAPESVKGVGGDSSRVLSHDQFDVVLTPEPTRIDYPRRPEALREWGWLILPVRWGFPAAPSLGSEIKALDLGNRSPYGPAYNTSWNRLAPTLLFPAYRIKKLSFARSAIEDLLQPWYYLYIFRSPRYVNDVRTVANRQELERLGLAPRRGWGERGMGGPILGVHVGFPTEGFSDLYGRSTGISLWRNFWAKFRFGAVELVGGYQKFQRTAGQGGALFVYPITANVVVRAPDALFRPYASLGAGAYGWDSRIYISPTERVLRVGWDLGWSGNVGFEYYLRPRVALDVGLRYHATGGPGPDIGISDGKLRFFTLWVGHYVRF